MTASSTPRRRTGRSGTGRTSRRLWGQSSGSTSTVRRIRGSPTRSQRTIPLRDLREPTRSTPTYGEDPYLVSRLGVAYIKGIQGEDRRRAVVATAKHFLGYGLSEGGLNHAPVQIGTFGLRHTPGPGPIPLACIQLNSTHTTHHRTPNRCTSGTNLVS